MNQELLGFDIRQCPGTYLQTAWNQETRRAFLLRPEVTWPLSVDTEVWPSVFDDVKEEDYPPGSVRPSLWLWFDLRIMHAFFLAHIKDQPQHGVSIAVVLVTKEPARLNDYWEGVLYPYSQLSPREVPTEWLFLGYDVADQYQLSGLANCRYEASEISGFAVTWAARLNEHGLFQTLDDAMSFRDLTDQRVREHAPFYVYGLFREPGDCNLSHAR
jgi:hypothetical protein